NGRLPSPPRRLGGSGTFRPTGTFLNPVKEKEKEERGGRGGRDRSNERKDRNDRGGGRDSGRRSRSR
ncbi:unnamed protein product, partial [Polarella glacialis]